MVFTLPKLSYDYSALEPHIDTKTMEIHHSKHHASYVEKLNAALEGKTEWLEMEINELLKRIDEVDDSTRQAVINHGGGHSNHSLFWEILTPGGSTEPSKELNEGITELWGSFEAFKEKMTDEGTKRFGSGWVWLVVKKDGGLEIYSTANQDSPYMSGDIPVLGIDVWEHAYYLKHQNKRPDYLAGIWSVINWDKVDEFYKSAKK